MAKCAHCDRAVKNPGQFELMGKQLCSATCHGAYERRCRKAAVR